MARSAAAARTAPARKPAPARRRPATTRPAAARQARPRPTTGQHVRAVVTAAPMGLMDRLLRGQGWVLLIGALLAGIVYLNVTLLEVNRGIASMSTQAAQLNRENSALRDEIAKKGTSEEIQKLAVGSGFVLPQPKDVVYLKADPVNDARLAAQVAAGAPTAPALDAPPEQADAAPADPQEPVAAVPQAPDTEGPG